MKRYLLTGAMVLLTGAAQAEDLTLVEVITSPERTELLQSQIDSFKTAHPDVEVEIVSLPWGQAFEKLATMVSGGEIPDVVEMPERWAALYADQLVDLEPYLAEWEHGETLTQKTLDMGSLSGGKMAMIPYGFYLRAMFYNKNLLEEAGIEQPPHTMQEFMDAAAAVSELDGKYGYCLRGGPGGLNGWMMMAAVMNGSNEFFTSDGQSRLNEPGSVEGIQFMLDLYQKGYAPKDSVNWGFNEIVAGFYSGTCAFLDQDPDALIGIRERMDEADFGVVPMPVGPSGKAYPTIGFAGWSVFDSAENPDLAFELVGHLASPENNIEWARNIGVIPIHEGADQDEYFRSEAFKGWFDTLNGEEYVPTLMPVYLPQFGYFADSMVIESSQEALLGQRTAQDVADEWAEFLTGEYADWKAEQ